jgi:hypothetical protein
VSLGAAIRVQRHRDGDPQAATRGSTALPDKDRVLPVQQVSRTVVGSAVTVNSGRAAGSVGCCSQNQRLDGEQMGLSPAAAGGSELRRTAPSSCRLTSGFPICAGQRLMGTTFTQESSTNSVEQRRRARLCSSTALSSVNSLLCLLPDLSCTSGALYREWTAWADRYSAAGVVEAVPALGMSAPRTAECSMKTSIRQPDDRR